MVTERKAPWSLETSINIRSTSLATKPWVLTVEDRGQLQACQSELVLILPHMRRLSLRDHSIL